MANRLAGVVSAVPETHTRRALLALGLDLKDLSGQLSAIRRNDEDVIGYGLENTATPGTYTNATVTMDSDHRITVLANGTAPPTGANPSASIGLTAVNGVATTFMRSDAAPALSVGIVPTWTGVHTYSQQDVHNAGVSLGTSGRINSAVADGAGVSSLLYQPGVALTSGTDRYIHHFKDQAGNTGFVQKADGTWEFGATSGSGGYIVLSASLAQNVGINFIPTLTGAGATFYSVANTVAGGYFKAGVPASPAAGTYVGGVFATSHPVISSSITAEWGGWFRNAESAVSNSTRTWTEVGGWKVFGMLTNMSAGTVTDWYGGYVSNACTGTGYTITNARGLYIEEQTRAGTINNGIFLANATSGRKCIAIRDQDAWIGSNAAATLTVGGTNFEVASTNFGWGLTPIARPTTAVAAATFVTNTSLIFDDSATFDGYTIGQVVKALRNLGLLT